MALRNASMFLYGFEITDLNKYVSFGADVGETPPDERTAVLNVGFYSLASLGLELVRAMSAADPANVYSFVTDRTIAGGTENRCTIGTSGSFLSLFFSTGNPANPASLLGFGALDYTGATTYTSSSTAGTPLVPNQLGYTFLPPASIQKNFGTLNVSASGLKEAIVFSLQSFWQVQFKYIPEALVESDWLPLIQWMIQQRELDFTPDITDGNTFYTGTLEDPDQGLSFNMPEMLPNFPFNYQTPLMKFRVRPGT